MDPDSSSIWAVGSLFSRIMALLVLLICIAFFTVSETAIIALNDNKVKKMAQDGDLKAKLILRLTENPVRFLAAVRTGAALSGFFAAALAVDAFAEAVIQALSDSPFSVSAARVLSLVAVTLAFSCVALVFGEMVPRRVAARDYEKLAFRVALLFYMAFKVITPIVAMLSAMEKAVLHILRIDPDQTQEEVTEEEIRMMIDVGEQSGTIEQSEKDMLNNVLELDDRTAEDIMTHRTEITAVEIGTPLDEVVQVALESGHSRIPVFEDDLDSIIGILYVKDLLKLISAQGEEEFDLRLYVREPLYVLESTSCRLLLEQFQAGKIHVAVVADEYGGTSGLVSMEDLLESIVGNIQDEYDDEEEEIRDVGGGGYLVDGLAAPDDVLKYFGLELEIDDDFDTIGGYIINELGYIPDSGSSPEVVVGDVRFTVREMDDHRVAWLFAQTPMAVENTFAGKDPGEG